MELNLEKDCGNGNNCRTGEGFIDRSTVRILLCDSDAKSSEEVISLLLRCSYQVVSVKTARQVIDALNAKGPEIDIVLSEIDIPMAKGMKMLKYITRTSDLRRIPVIMMSALDEVSIVVKCLRLGAADYLVKPLRTNELLNLWTHMWRRRRMLGLAEKNMVNYDFDLAASDLAASDPSDANTNSTTLFSDDDKSCRGTNPESVPTTHHENEVSSTRKWSLPHKFSLDQEQSAIVAEDLLVTDSPDYGPVVPGISERRTGQLSSGPKKSKLKIGESSAFFTYVKSNMPRSNDRAASHVEEDPTRHSRMEDLNEAQMAENGDAGERNSLGDDFPSSTSLPDSHSIMRSEFLQSNINEHKSSNGSSLAARSVYPFYVPNQMMMSLPTHLYSKNLQGLQNPHGPRIASLAYYPINMCLQPGQIPGRSNSWQPMGTSSSLTELNPSKVDRREAALIKFRQKRKERCFDKKIRYVNRKKLAERRPRVRGQFVRKMNGVDVDLNGQPASIAEDEDEEEYVRDSSQEDDASEY